jgi:hypothetical protein
VNVRSWTRSWRNAATLGQTPILSPAR